MKRRISTDELDIARAERDAALTCLARLVRQLERISGYSTYAEQAELREARALLLEVKR